MNIRIKQIRKMFKLTQDEFGKKIGISNTAVSKIEKGENSVSEQNIISICREFNINEQWLRNGTGNMLEQLSEAEKVMKYTALLLKDTDSKVAKAIKSFIVTYEQLDDTSKDVLEKIADKYLESMKKDQS